MYRLLLLILIFIDCTYAYFPLTLVILTNFPALAVLANLATDNAILVANEIIVTKKSKIFQLSAKYYATPKPTTFIIISPK